jgi:hypothetical protein
LIRCRDYKLVFCDVNNLVGGAAKLKDVIDSTREIITPVALQVCGITHWFPEILRARQEEALAGFNQLADEVRGVFLGPTNLNQAEDAVLGTGR